MISIPNKWFSIEPLHRTLVTDGASQMSETDIKHNPTVEARARWLKRLGLAGFLFFFAKGMLWLVLPVLLYRGCA